MAIEADTERFDQDLRKILGQLAVMPAAPLRLKDAPSPPPIMLAIVNGVQKYTAIHTPVLAMFADPHDFSNLAEKDPTRADALRTHDEQVTTAQAEAFQAAIRRLTSSGFLTLTTFSTRQMRIRRCERSKTITSPSIPALPSELPTSGEP